ncbi:MAG: ATP-binding protein [bacterium]
MKIIEALTAMDALKAKLHFKRDAVDKIIRHHERNCWPDCVEAVRRMREDTGCHGEDWSYELHRLYDDVADAVNRLDILIESFPSRHRDNLSLALSANHPAWTATLHGIISQLGTGSIFVLLGDRGRGKTQLATATARHVAEVKNLKSSYVVLGDLFTQIKGTFKSGSVESEDSIVDLYSRTPLLVVDECHEISGTEWQGQIFTRLIDSRYREKRSTILITNDTEQAFIAMVGASIADRLAECGYFIECNWPSFRRAR